MDYLASQESGEVQSAKRLLRPYVNRMSRRLPPLPWWPSYGRRSRREEVILVGGTARSGNHLLRGLLDGHPHLLTPPDEDYSLRALARSPFLQIRGWLASSDTAPDFYRRIQKQGHFERINEGLGVNSPNEKPVLNLHRYYEYIRQNHQRFSFRGLVSTHLEALEGAIHQPTRATPLKRVYFCALNPLCNDLVNLGRLLTKTYRVRAVLLRRDPVAIFASGKERGYFHAVEAFCRFYAAFLKQVEKFRDEKLGEVHLVSFEDLIEHTERCMREVAAFVDVPFCDEMLRFTQNGIEIGSNSSFGQEKGIDRQVLNRYAKVLTSGEIDQITRQFGDQMSRVGEVAEEADG